MTGDSLTPGRPEGERGRAADAADAMSTDAYLRRIGVDPGTVGTPDRDTLARLQRAHVTAVPFENLSIVGSPTGAGGSEGVVLSLPAVYGKVVGRERGGYCFELNGLFGWLLAELGYDVDRVAARVTSDGEARPPANHHTNVVELDRRYVVDVGMGAPMMRRPTPLDGTLRSDDVGVTWRVAESDRPDATYCTQYRSGDGNEWETRYVFSDVPRDLRYFEATNDYLQSAPESPFTEGPVAVTATDEGHRRLTAETFSETTERGELAYGVDEVSWLDTLESEFGLTLEE